MARWQRQPLDLALLLRDSIISKCILWFEVGLELGLANHELEIIKTDHPNDTKTCIREMWSLWLRDGRLLDLEEVYEKIRFVERRARTQNRQKIEYDDKNAEFAIRHLEKSIKEFKQYNQQIAEDHRSFTNELTQERDWLSGRKEWEEEDEEWRQGEMATTLANLKEAIEAGNFQSSRFVQQFFQQKRMSLDSMSTMDIEYHLHRELLQIEVERSKTVRGRHGKRKEHDKHVKYLLKEIEKSENLIRKRIKAYDQITEGLRRLGIDESKLNKLDEEVENVKTTLHECTKARKDCEKVYENGRHNLQQSKVKVEKLLASFGNFTTHVRRMEEQLRSEEEAAKSLMESIMEGAANGADIGNRFFPIIGYIPGGIIGGVGGLIKGLVEDRERLRRELQENLDNSRRMIRNCEEILARADQESAELRNTLMEDQYSGFVL
jgi:chromosome segregation ATPase